MGKTISQTTKEKYIKISKIQYYQLNYHREQLSNLPPLSILKLEGK